ncbi:MFS general substrate transporter [Sodiomyces alkalinus F11]|uniref:MFS general substrate transporter n=1 Tax=Sodiomyces alkalinus (strain CBS 110278 / VKM F-3762 / F11) TaxID=1314773 RepID=A0A3N2Q190_SODAK|nr:MFS general substrate transporter [Sodiomyces alkalinus F11]ROT40527.1 MFS general substrate transporter [Sodiomyces alkalinus F11]
MAGPSRSGFLRPGDASPSFAQTTAEFSLESDLDLDDDDAKSDFSLREAGSDGGEAFEMKRMRQQHQGPVRSQGVQDDEEDEEDSDGWIRPGSASVSASGSGSGPAPERHGSVSSVASFQLYTPDEEQAVVRKFDRRLVLFMALLYMLSFLDRSNIGNARVAGMEEDLQTDPPWQGWYQWALTSFYITYILFEWMSLLWKLIPAHIYVCLVVLSWGVVASLQAIAVSYPMLIALRAILGIGEAAFTGVPFYLSFFYKREELAFRTAIFVSAAPLASSFAASLAWLVVKLGSAGPIAPWRLLFLVEGFPSVLVSLLAWRIVPDAPETASYLTPRERKVARLRLRREKAHGRRSSSSSASSPSSSSSSSSKPTARGSLKAREILQTLRDPLAWLTAGMLFLANMAYASLPVFLPTILSEMGHSRLAAQALSAPPYLVAFASVLATAAFSDRRRSRAYPIALHALASAAGYAVLALAKPLDLPPAVRYAAVYPAAAGFFSVVVLVIAWSVNNQPSDTRQGAGFALLQVVGQCGPLVGTRLYPDRDAPFYAPGMLACACAMLAVAFLALALRVYLGRLNVRLDRAHADGGDTSHHENEGGEEEVGLVKSNPRRRTLAESFRYIL